MAVYSGVWDGPARNYRRDRDGDPVTSRKKYITIHNTSNDASAEGEASYAKRRTDGTSSHYYCDHDSLVQSLDTDWCAGHVGSFEGNTYGISYEITGFNSWSRSRWMSSVAWDVAATQMARDCREHGIEVRLLTVTQMRAGSTTGFITHDLARRAWGETDHTDPGPGFPMDHLLALVSRQLGGDDMAAEDVWGMVIGSPALGAREERWGDGEPASEYLKRAAMASIDAAHVREQVEALSAAVAELAARPPVQPAPVDPVALKAALSDPEVLAAIAVAVADEDHRRTAQ